MITIYINDNTSISTEDITEATFRQIFTDKLNYMGYVNTL